MRAAGCPLEFDQALKISQVCCQEMQLFMLYFAKLLQHLKYSEMITFICVGIFVWGSQWFHSVKSFAAWFVNMVQHQRKICDVFYGSSRVSFVMRPCCVFINCVSI
jgi:hypothetical protein